MTGSLLDLVDIAHLFCSFILPCHKTVVIKVWKFLIIHEYFPQGVSAIGSIGVKQYKLTHHNSLNLYHCFIGESRVTEVVNSEGLPSARPLAPVAFIA